MPRLSAIVVTHNSRAELERSLPALASELRPADELIVVDNASVDGSAELARALAPRARVIEAGRNLGYGAGCNLGAESASGDLLLMINPDAIVAPGFRDAIARPLMAEPGWAAWQGLVTAEDGNVINSVGGTVHYTGVAWIEGAGRPRAGAVGDRGSVGFATGACLAVPRERWRELGGFPAQYFLYHEDVDLSLRVRLAGAGVGIEPGAIAEHEYEFDKGAAKWRYLERNRWATIIRTYPGALLAVLAPALIATEIALVAVALAGGWMRQKLLAWSDLARGLPRLLAERRALQSTRRVGAAEFATGLSARLDSPYLSRLAHRRSVRALSRAYWAVARGLLRGARRRRKPTP